MRSLGSSNQARRDIPGASDLSEAALPSSHEEIGSPFKKFPREALLDKLALEVHKGRTIDADGIVSYTPEAQRVRDKLAVESMEMIFSLVRRWTRPGAREDLGADLFSAGCVGAAKAIDRFDPSKGASFGAYAAQLIRGEILDEIENGRAVVGWDNSASRDFKEIAKFEREFFAARNRKPDENEIAGGIHAERVERKLRRHPEESELANEPGFVRPLSPERVSMLKDTKPTVVSIAAPKKFVRDEDGSTWEDSLQCPNSGDIISEIADQEVIDRLGSLITEKLTEKQKDAILRYYGFAAPDGQPEPAPKIAADWGTSSSNVHKVVVDGLNKLRAARFEIDPDRAEDADRLGVSAKGTRQRDGHLFWNRSSRSDWLEVKRVIAELHDELKRAPSVNEVIIEVKASRRMEGSQKHNLPISDPELDALTKRIADSRIKALIEHDNVPKDLVAKALRAGIDPNLSVSK